jgi:hypothetical protein
LIARPLQARQEHGEIRAQIQAAFQGAERPRRSRSSALAAGDLLDRYRPFGQFGQDVFRLKVVSLRE